MAIKRMISRDPAEFRAFQSRMTTVGKIRLGTFETPEGRKGRPVKLDTFRFTADNEALIRAVAEVYGGTVEQWTPQGSKTAQWEVVTDAKAVEVYAVNGQKIDPVYEAWAGGRTCVRRCDGEWEQIKQDACLCNGPARPRNPQELCKITTRVQLMLQRIQGLGSWLLESHGENFAIEVSTFSEFIATAPMPVPAMLRLRKETRRVWNPAPAKGDPRFETLEFYVPWLDISAVNARMIAIGGDALTQALTAAGAPSAIGGSAQMAIETRPVSAPVPTPAGPVGAAPFDIEAKRPAILLDIEACTTVEALNGIRDKLIERGVDDQQVREAWRSKMNAVEAAAGLAEVQRMNAAAIASGTGRLYRVLVTGSRTWTDAEKINEQLGIAKMTHPGRMVVVNGMCPDGADRIAFEWAERNGVPTEPYRADWNGPDGKRAGFVRNQVMVDSRPDIVLSFNRMQSKGTEHCTAAAEAAGLKVLRFTDDTPFEPPVPESVPNGMPLKEYRVGDTVTVGGIEFTKIREMPSVEDMLFGAQQEEALNPDPGEPVEGTVEEHGTVLPDVPDGDYDADELYTLIMTGAGQQNPPLLTGDVNALICDVIGVDMVSEATGRDLARLRAGLKSGAVSWR